MKKRFQLLTKVKIVKNLNFILMTLCIAVGISFLEGETLQAHPPMKDTWAEQGWTPEQRDFYHYTSQGVVLGKISWFMALEQEFKRRLFSDPAYLATFGFMNEPSSPSNPLGLPVGFAVAQDDGQTGIPIPGTWGLTCAACHTGSINYRGNTIRIDGGQAQNILTVFSDSFYGSMLANYYDKGKWNRFVKRILGPEPTESAVNALREEFGSAVETMELNNSLTDTLNLYPTADLVGRNPAVGKISNEVFGFDLAEIALHKNLNQFSSPTDYPTLWDIWRLDWVQYGGEVAQPMTRNIGEVLGVGALTNFIRSASDPNPGDPNPTPEKWITSANVPNLAAIEEQLHTLRAPLWPENLLGAYDKKLAKQGQKLFNQLCVNCHGVRPIAAPGNVMAEWAVTMVPLATIGTDPQRSFAWDNNFVDASKLTGASSPDLLDTSEGLEFVTKNTKNQAYDELGLSPSERKEYDGFGRPGLVRNTGSYKAKPLDGIWASPPYLHNGSVPNMYQLLSPVAQRPTKFWVSLNQEYDPVHLGHESVQSPNAYNFDTALTGNSNAGHEFSNDKNKLGVIGRFLKHAERLALIEYLKALPQMPADVQKTVPLDYYQYIQP